MILFHTALEMSIFLPGETVSPSNANVKFFAARRKIRPAMVSYGQLWSAMVSYCQLWSALVIYCQLWSVMVSYGQLWSAMNHLWLLRRLYYLNDKSQRGNVIILRLNQLLQRHTRAVIPAKTADRIQRPPRPVSAHQTIPTRQANRQVRIGGRNGPRLATVEPRPLRIRQVLIPESNLLLCHTRFATASFEVSVSMVLRALPRLTASHVPLGPSLHLATAGQCFMT